MDASCKIQRSIHDVRLTYKYVSRILGTYQILSGCIRFFYESGSACTEWYSYAEMFLRSFF